MSAEKRINHPQELLKNGQIVKAQVLAVDMEKRQLRLSMKQLVPTGADEYIAEHKAGDIVSGRVVEVTDGHARIELGDRILATCSENKKTAGKKIAGETSSTQGSEEPSKGKKADLSALGSMLQARWKSGPVAEAKQEVMQAGQIRKFRILKLDAESKKIDLELA